MFVFLFLTLNLVCYYSVKTIRQKNIVLLVFSLIFYAWGGAAYLLLLAGMAFWSWLCALMIEKNEEQKTRKLWMWAECLVLLGLLIFFKYMNFLTGNLSALIGFPKEATKIILPIGISFYTFQLLSYVVDVYRKEVAAQPAYWKLLLYCRLFHQCIAGPIVRYQTVASEIDDRKVTLTDLTNGIRRFSIGLAKKAILANGCASVADTLLANTQSATTAGLWLGMLFYMLQIYLDFSAYSDMAIGMGKMLGFTFPENFNFPYISDSITEFWRRWHMTLSGWFREYVYIPLGGNRVSMPRHILNLLIVWVLTGFWHGAAWNFILWGLYYGILLILEKYIFAPLLKKLPKAARHIYTMLLVMFGWVLFSNTDFGSMRTYVGTLFGIGTKGFLDLAFFYYIRNNLIILIMGVLCATPLIRNYIVRCSRKKPEVTSAVLLLLGILSIAFLVYGTYNPFLYFRF